MTAGREPIQGEGEHVEHGRFGEVKEQAQGLLRVCRQRVAVQGGLKRRQCMAHERVVVGLRLNLHCTINLGSCHRNDKEHDTGLLLTFCSGFCFLAHTVVMC